MKMIVVASPAFDLLMGVIKRQNPVGVKELLSRNPLASAEPSTAAADLADRYGHAQVSPSAVSQRGAHLYRLCIRTRASYGSHAVGQHRRWRSGAALLRCVM
jgi:hypothetical protein